MASQAEPWEWVIVDDHSSDRTPQVIAELSSKDNRVSGVRLSRTFGDHTAIYCGLTICRGSAAATWSADPNSSPEPILEMVRRWREGAQVVWAQPERTARGPGWHVALHHWLLKKVLGNRDLPSDGIDHVLLDRKVLDSLKQMREVNFSIFALVAWMGFRQATVSCPPSSFASLRRAPSLRQRLGLILDTVVSFSMFPIRLVAASGVILAMLGLLYVPVLIYNWWSGAPVTGWTELVVVILILGGLLIIQSSISGEYLWRTLGETRGRPRFIIEASYGFPEGTGRTAPGTRQDLPSSSHR